MLKEIFICGKCEEWKRVIGSKEEENNSIFSTQHN